VSNVVDMRSVFRDATSFNQDLSNWDVSSVETMDYMFDGVALSTVNYDALLMGWATQTLQSNVVFDGGNSSYCNGEAARTILTDNPNNWLIRDGGKNCTLSVSDNHLELSMKAYPNPTSGAFIIQLGEVNKNIKIRIINALGQVIKEANYSNQKTINLNIDGAKGLYFLYIQNGEGLSKYLNIIKK